MSSASTRTSTSPTRSSRKSPNATVLGVDPGTTGMGYAVLAGASVETLALRSSGVVPTPRDGTNAVRLLAVAKGLDALIRTHAPTAIAVERLFFNKNARTAMAVGEARGVALLCAARAGVPVFEYTPQQVKLAVTGYGNADKRAVQNMLRLLLRLEKPIRQDDEADAAAVALCHAQARPLEAALGLGAARQGSWGPPRRGSAGGQSRAKRVPRSSIQAPEPNE